MSSSLKNIIVVIGAMIMGGVLIYGIESLNHLVFPPPADLNTSDMEALKAYMQQAPAGSLAILLLAHASGAFISGWIISRFAASNIRMLVLITGMIWMITGVINLIVIPHPLWFSVADACIYLPMTIIGARMSSSEV
jgi:hypothetical protein